MKYFHPHIRLWKAYRWLIVEIKRPKLEDKSLFPSSAEVQHVWCLRTEQVLTADMPSTPKILALVFFKVRIALYYAHIFGQSV